MPSRTPPAKGKTKARAKPKSSAAPRRPRRAGGAKAPVGLPEDDRFAPHPGEPIDTVYVVGRAAELVRSRFREVGGVMLASTVLSGLMIFLMMLVGAVHNPLWEAAGIADAMQPTSLVALMLLGWSCALLLQTPLVGSAIEVHTGEPRGLFWEFLRRGLDQFGTIVLASLGVIAIVLVALTVAIGLQFGVVKMVGLLPEGYPAIGVMIGFVASVTILVYTLRVIAAFSLVVPIIVVEGCSAGAALARSWQRGWPNGVPIFLALLLPALLAQAVLFPASYLPEIVGIVLSIVFSIALALYNSAIVPVSYVAIREYVDGIDPAKLVDDSRRSRR